MVTISEKVKISFRIDKDTRKTINQMALDNETTATEIYNKAIQEYIQRQTKQSTLNVE